MCISWTKPELFFKKTNGTDLYKCYTKSQSDYEEVKEMISVSKISKMNLLSNIRMSMIIKDEIS